jgi:hypothetical protein
MGKGLAGVSGEDDPTKLENGEALSKDDEENPKQR